MAHLSQPLTYTSFTISKTNKQKKNFSSLWIDSSSRGSATCSLSVPVFMYTCAPVPCAGKLTLHCLHLSLSHTIISRLFVASPKQSFSFDPGISFSSQAKVRFFISFLFFFSFVGPLLGQSLCSDPTCGVIPPPDYLEEEVFRVGVPPSKFSTVAYFWMANVTVEKV